jgi:hypothetical protein
MESKLTVHSMRIPSGCKIYMGHLQRKFDFPKMFCGALFWFVFLTVEDKE